MVLSDDLHATLLYIPGYKVCIVVVDYHGSTKSADLIGSVGFSTSTCEMITQNRRVDTREKFISFRCHPSIRSDSPYTVKPEADQRPKTKHSETEDPQPRGGPWPRTDRYRSTTELLCSMISEQAAVSVLPRCK